jgi:hypothetical protein
MARSTGMSNAAAIAEKRFVQSSPVRVRIVTLPGRQEALTFNAFDLLPAMVYRDLTAYAEILKREGQQSTADATTLVAPMLARFMATDRAFRKLRRGFQQKGSASAAAKSE